MVRLVKMSIEERILPAVSVLSYDIPIAKVFGQIRAYLEEKGTRLHDADLQIASTVLYHGLELVTGNLRHFQRIPAIKLSTILADARKKR